MCSSTSLRRHAPWQLAILRSFACISLQAALHEPCFRDFRLTLRGLAATASLLSTIHVADSCSRVRMWRRRLVQVHGRQFSIRTLVQVPHSTYLLFSAAYSDVQEDQTAAPTFKIRKEFYIGCTSCSCQRRQDARLRKYKQLQSFQPVSCELALHWFHNHNNIHDYIMVPLIPCHSDLQVKTTEASLIQKWTPMLNFPFIVCLMPTKKVTSTKQFVHSLSTKFGVPGNRLFRKLRHRLFHTMRLHLYHRSIFQNDHQWYCFSWQRTRISLFRWPSHSAARSIPQTRFSRSIASPTIWKIHLDPGFGAYSRRRFSSRAPCCPAEQKHYLSQFLLAAVFPSKFDPGSKTLSLNARTFLLHSTCPFAVSSLVDSPPLRTSFILILDG